MCLNVLYPPIELIGVSIHTLNCRTLWQLPLLAEILIDHTALHRWTLAPHIDPTKLTSCNVHVSYGQLGVNRICAHDILINRGPLPLSNRRLAQPSMEHILLSTSNHLFSHMHRRTLLLTPSHDCNHFIASSYFSCSFVTRSNFA